MFRRTIIGYRAVGLVDGLVRVVDKDKTCIRESQIHKTPYTKARKGTRKLHIEPVIDTKL